MAAPRIPMSLRLLRLIYRSLGSLFPERFGRLAWETWFSPMRFARPEREQPIMADAVPGETDVHGLPVTTYQWRPESGEQGSVLFVHGWSGRGSQGFAFVPPLLEAGYRVTSFDGPAHGRTPGNMTSVLQFADALLALQRQHGHFDGVITHSFGGMVLAFASRHGFSPGRAVCICPPHDLGRLIDNLSTALALPPAVLDALVRRLQASHGHLTRDLVDTCNNAPYLDYPGLIIHDRDDAELPWQGSEHLHELWSGSELMLTGGLKHHRILRDTAVVRASVDFLTRR